MIDVDSRGGSFGAVVDALAGSARLQLRDGAVPLFGIAEFGTPGGSADPLAMTPVTSLDAAMSFAGGSGTIERVSIIAPSFSAEATGRIAFRDGGLSLDGTLQSTATGVEAPARPFHIDGSLRQLLPLALAN
jgi:uncharacterized protein involved in outer membrane biogenesis